MTDGRGDRRRLRTTPVRGLALVAVVALVVAACGGDDDEQAGASANVDFSSGEIPDTVPLDFPIPDQAVIGSTVVNGNVDPVFTEMVIRMPAPVASVAQYYATNLPARNFEIAIMDTDSAGRLVIEFSREGSDFRIQLTDLGDDITSAVVQFSPPEE